MIWEFVEELEPPRVVNTRATIFLTSDNIFAQITVRMKMRQVGSDRDAKGHDWLIEW